MLKRGDQLLRSEWLTSPNENFALIMQKNGNLVLYNFNSKHELWESKTDGIGNRLIMNRDGSLVIVNSKNTRVWGYYKTQYYGFALLDSGVLALINKIGVIITSLNRKG